MQTLEFFLVGTAPYMQARFSEKQRNQMREKQAAGSVAKKGKARAARDFQGDYEAAIHRDEKGGWAGIPASAFRAACISACRLVGFKMTLAKLSIFTESDGLDIDGTPLIKIIGEPEVCEMPVRNATGVMDIRVRPLWREWSCRLRLRYDMDQFAANDVANLLMRVGMQVGIGEGRPDSRQSAGLGYGLFRSERT
jgi:hypothetical protein